jgi:parallel beta-helix repeat protein
MTRPDLALARIFGGRLLVAAAATAIALSCAPARTSVHEPRVWVVAQSGPRDHATIRAAIAAAAPGDTVRIGPGRWEERVVVDKRLTLVGSSAHETLIVAGVPPGFFTEDEQVRLQGELAAVASDEERAEFLDSALSSKAVVLVTADGVGLEALGVHLEGRGDAGSVQRGAAVILVADGARIRDCAIVGSPCSGVRIEGNDVVVERTLVAAVEATGIEVARGSGRVEIHACDVRDAIHRGITIARDDVLVENCRISGSSWHGIRYDGVGPTIRNNVIFENKRFGIYASGRTSAEISGNLFLQNGFSGLSAWFENGDTLLRNTFAYNGRAALEVLGAARPVLMGNVFAWSPTGVIIGDIGGDASEPRPNSHASGALDLTGNAFFRCGRNALWASSPESTQSAPRELTAAERGYEVLDPGFAAPRARDFSLPDGSVGKTRGLGAVDFPELQSPWPRRAPELDVASTLDPLPTDSPSPPKPPSLNPFTVSTPWVESAEQTTDAARRGEAVRQVGEAVNSDDPTLLHAGLLAVSRLNQSNIDWRPLRERIVALCRTLDDDEAMRRAFYALRAAGPEDGDVALVLGRMRGGMASPQMSHLLMIYSGGDVSGEVAEQVLGLLNTTDADHLREVMRGLWGARVEAAVEARLLEISYTRSEQDCIYFALSTLQDKSPAVIARLFEAARNPDYELFSRALWGLGHGIPEGGRSDVADGAAALLQETFVPEQRQVAIREDARHLIEVHGTR